MEERLGRKKFRLYAFDIESHNDSESISKMESSMWLGCLIDDTSSEYDLNNYFFSMHEVVERLRQLTTLKRKNKSEKKPCNNICIYIYNLSFEWSFLLPVLIKDYNIKFKSKIEKDDEFVFNSISTKSCSSVWEVNLKLDKHGGLIKLRDLAKMYGGGLSKVAKAFKLPTQKGEIDYRLNRLDHNQKYKIYIPTEEERSYIFKDCRIIIDILLIMQKKCDKLFFKSISMASYSTATAIKEGWPRKTKPYLEFRRMYPELEEEETNFLREGVEGGICYASKRWQFVNINQKIGHIDAHQMHPTQMYTKLYPYGVGIYHTGKPHYKVNTINCIRIKISYDDVKLHSIIKLIGLDFVEDKEITIWDFELPTMYKCYVNLRVEYIDYYEYNAKPLKWRNYYKHNYLKRLKAKQEGDAFNTLYYKLLNNSSYGKLLEKPHNYIFENCLIDDVINSTITEKEGEEIEVNAKYTYLPAGSCIPAYSRVQLIETALLFGWENVIYFDTDSIFFILNEKTQAVWNSDLINKDDFLGGWGWEETSTQAQFTAPKRYKLLKDNGETIVRMAGVNFKNMVEFSELNITDSSWKVNRAFRCKGGTLIDFQDKKLSVQKKYQDIYLNNKELTI